MDVSKVSSNIKGSEEYDRSLVRQHPGIYTHCPSFEAAKKANRMYRYYVAQQFMKGCTFDSVHKTCIQSPGVYSWLDNSYGIMWVAMHGTDNSICVVTRHSDLDLTRVSRFHKILPKHKVMYALTGALMSEIEGLPYDDKFHEMSGQSIKKPFGVVSVIPVTKKSDEETGKLASSVEYDENKAINILMEKIKSESAITYDETIKTAISAFHHLCLQELKAEDFWVTAWNGEGVIRHLLTSDIEGHLAVIDGGSGSCGSTNNEIMDHLAVNKSGFGSGDLTNKATWGHLVVTK